MMTWALTFFLIAIVAAIFGFSGVASSAVGIAQVLFFVFLVAFVVSLFVDTRRRSPKAPL